MDNRSILLQSMHEKKSCLCVGLDVEFDLLPEDVKHAEDPVFEFNRQTIQATLPFTVAYKLNTAFYECLGPKGWETLEKTIRFIGNKALTIADAKRGDIGNTAKAYAKAFFQNMNADAVTVSPYMGNDSLLPFLEYKNKWTIALGLTSNPGAANIQMQKLSSGHHLYETAMANMADMASPNQLMFVVGATRPAELKALQHRFPEYFFLIPGVGAQGGSVPEVLQAMGPNPKALINASRSIIYAGSGPDFAQKAGLSAQNLQKEMEAYF
jgi:orotidine-5'-phosphate decarboxylase